MIKTEEQIEKATKIVSAQPISSSNDKKKILMQKRARELASVTDEKVESKDTIEIVEFTLSKEIYGIEAKYVKEIYIFNHIRKIPGTPDFMPGVINYHGKIISIIDLKKLLGLDPSSGETIVKEKGLILFWNESELAIMIDSVVGIKASAINDISRGFSHNKNSQENFISAITNDHTIILDAPRIVSDQRITINIS